jgi:hypothetical protein
MVETGVSETVKYQSFANASAEDAPLTENEG